MLKFKPTRRFNKPAIVIDVGSHSLKGLVFQSRGEDRFEIIAKKQVKLPFIRSGFARDENLFSRTAVKLHELIIDLIRVAEDKPERLILAMGSNASSFHLDIWTARLAMHGSRLSKNLLAQYFDNLKKQHLGENPSSLAFLQEIDFNGHPIHIEHLWEKTFRTGDFLTLNFKVLLLETAPEMLAIFRTISETFKGIAIELIPLALAQKKVIVKKLNIRDALLVDVGGERTLLARLKNGLLVGLKSFPLGGREFLWNIAKAAGTTCAEAEDLKKQYSQGILNKNLTPKVKKAIDDSLSIWKHKFKESVGFLHHTGPLTENILLFGGGGRLPEIRASLRDEWFRDFSHLDRPEVKILGGETLFKGHTSGGEIQGPEDFGLASLMLY